MTGQILQFKCNAFIITENLHLGARGTFFFFMCVCGFYVHSLKERSMCQRYSRNCWNIFQMHPAGSLHFFSVQETRSTNKGTLGCWWCWPAEKFPTASQLSEWLSTAHMPPGLGASRRPRYRRWPEVKTSLLSFCICWCTSSLFSLSFALM